LPLLFIQPLYVAGRSKRESVKSVIFKILHLQFGNGWPYSIDKLTLLPI
jgi:hypothetical protein